LSVVVVQDELPGAVEDVLEVVGEIAWEPVDGTRVRGRARGAASLHAAVEARRGEGRPRTGCLAVGDAPGGARSGRRAGVRAFRSAVREADGAHAVSLRLLTLRNELSIASSGAGLDRLVRIDGVVEAGFVRLAGRKTDIWRAAVQLVAAESRECRSYEVCGAL